MSIRYNISKQDKPKIGYYESPWPIQKILTKPGAFHNFEIRVLGASLSAFDVVTSLANRHRIFKTVGNDSACRVIGKHNTITPNIYNISFTDIHSYRSYSYGLQACNATSSIVIESLISSTTTKHYKI